MRRKLVQVDISVRHDDLIFVDVKDFVWIDRNQNWTDVRLKNNNFTFKKLEKQAIQVKTGGKHTGKFGTVVEQ